MVFGGKPPLDLDRGARPPQVYEDGDFGDSNGIKRLYCGVTQNQEHCAYDPEPQESIGSSASNISWRQSPKMLQFLNYFGLTTLSLTQIVMQSTLKQTGTLQVD